jgi:histidine triad (HIT) family protein
MSSIFTKIVNGEIPCYKIAEDDHYLALDVNQMQRAYFVYQNLKSIRFWYEAHYLDDFCKKVAIALEKQFLARIEWQS